MFRNILFLFLCPLLFAPLHAFGKPFSNIKEMYFNLGSHTEFYNAVQTNDSGGLRKFDLAPTIGLGLVLPIVNSWNFLPEFNWVLPKTYENSHLMVSTLMYRFDIGYDPLDWLRLRMGTSLMHMNQQGRGGNTKMNNGTNTSTFYYPSENRSSFNNTLDFGIETIYEKFSFRIQTYTYSIFKKEQRQNSYTLFLTYYWEK